MVVAAAAVVAESTTSSAFSVDVSAWVGRRGMTGRTLPCLEPVLAGARKQLTRSDSSASVAAGVLREKTVRNSIDSARYLEDPMVSEAGAVLAVRRGTTVRYQSLRHWEAVMASRALVVQGGRWMTTLVRRSAAAVELSASLASMNFETSSSLLIHLIRPRNPTASSVG